MVGTPLHDVITGSDEGEVLAGSGGNNQLTGGGGPDAFFLKKKGYRFYRGHLGKNCNSKDVYKSLKL